MLFLKVFLKKKIKELIPRNVILNKESSQKPGERNTCTPKSVALVRSSQDRRVLMNGTPEKQNKKLNLLTNLVEKKIIFEN